MMDKPEDSYLERISGFVAGIVDGRDPDLGGHHERLGQMAASFAQHAGCSSEEAGLFSIGASIHDLGKLSISEHILNKPARLTASEFSLVKQHAEIGSQLVAPLGLDSRIAGILRHHHENYDGSGYPDGLSGQAIPRLARIVRIWDSYDALIIDRPYHQGIPGREALLVLQKDAHFYDPSLLESFCEMAPEHFMD